MIATFVAEKHYVLERSIFSLALCISIILNYSLQLFLLATAFPTTENGKKIFSRVCCGLFFFLVMTTASVIAEGSDDDFEVMEDNGNVLK